MASARKYSCFTFSAVINYNREMNQFIELLNHNLADNLTVSHDSPKSEKTDLRPILMSILINKT